MPRATTEREAMTLQRIYHTWDEWECYPAGFYENRPADKSLTDDECREIYRDLLADEAEFRAALKRVLTEWPNSCEHYLSNERMNRIAWLGQASLCIEKGIPSRYRGGYMLLTDEQKLAADQAALDALNDWLAARGEELATLESAGSKAKVNLY